MTFFKSLLPLFTILAASLILVSAEINTCVKVVNDHIFNLCPFKQTFSTPSYHGDLANVTWGFNQPIVPSCQNSTNNSWISATYLQNQTCLSSTIEPEFYYVTDLFGNPGIQFHYTWQDKVFPDTYISIVCNKTAPHDAQMDFPYSGFYGEDFIITGHSYYGCPVIKASDSNFLPL